MEEELQLKVDKAYPIDLGRGTIRLDPASMFKLQFSPGDIAEISGTRKTVARVWRAERQDWEKEIVRIDNFTRQNAGVSIGDIVTIKRVEAQVAKKLILELPKGWTHEELKLRIGEHVNEILKRYILQRPVLKGDTIPIIHANESQSTLVIPLFTVDTEPSNTVVQVFEITNIEILNEPVSNKIIQNKTIENSAVKEPLIDRSENLVYTKDAMQVMSELFNYEKKEDEITIITLSEAIVKTKDRFEKIRTNIKKYNTDYAVVNSTTLSVLEKLIDGSDKTIFEYIYNLKFREAFSYINELESKLETYHRAALSEIVHRKIKEIEFQVNNPFLFSKSRKEYRRSVNELSQLDNDGIQGTKDLKEFTLTLEQIMKKLQFLEDDLDDENRSGIRHTVMNYSVVGLSLLFGFYQLVAVNYFNTNRYLPFIIFISLLVIIYLFIKNGVNLKIFQLAIKSKLMGPETFILFLSTVMFILILFLLLCIFIQFPPGIVQTETDFYAILISSSLFSLILLILVYITGKDSIQKLKSKLIKKEVDNLIKKYNLDSNIQP